MDSSSKWLQLIDEDRFSDLFIDELGWNKPEGQTLKYSHGNQMMDIVPIASFKGIQVWACDSLPNALIQRDIDKEVSKISAERLVIFYDGIKQTWKWPMSRETSGKGTVRLVGHDHIRGQNTLSLLQRLKTISISLNDSEPTLVEMLLRMRKAFDAEQVTKKFYKEFSAHQRKLVAQLEGLEKESDKEWYSSLLLNRIMFIYFMQWKGFMDGNQNYLADRLKRIKKLRGQNEFFGFFKDFLLPLFHKGLGAGTEITVPPEIAEIVGQIPYVNGGIFSEHELEMAYPINIPDEAFEEIFTFFDNYQWHLDARPTGTKNEINPDVLGYVFEQFINNKDQGAYYTKEDITDYMTSNTLVVNFLQKISQSCQINLLKPLVQNPDRYIWDSLKYGENVPRDSQEMSLPGESVIEAEKRIEYFSKLKNRIALGNISNITELISLNIDVELLATDIIDNLDTAEDVIKIWNILSAIKVIDPTCGSGAFLFSALKQLESLYSVLLDVAELHARSSRNPQLVALLEDVSRHPNRKYFVLKHAAQKNLYGVDLMKEAAEIARLRLFLKLISAIETYQDIEPLPDLEFNIKSGNLLVGITTSSNLPDYLNTFDASTMIEDINNQVSHLADLWENFQLSQELGHEKSKNAKRLLSNGTLILKSTLDKLLYESVSLNKNKITLEEWKESSAPFHWFVEFPDVFQQNGFDVVIGNPPYIKKSKVDYEISGHITSSCADIYAMCMERASLICHPSGIFSMIVMLNLAFGERYDVLREFLTKRFGSRWISGYGNRPSMLFDGVEVRNTIFIGTAGERVLHSAPMHRWTKDYRPNLMSNIRYSIVPKRSDVIRIWPFITSLEVFNLLTSKMSTLKQEVLPRGPKYELVKGVPEWDKSSGDSAPLFYMGTARYWISCFKVVPPSEDGNGNSVISSKLNIMWFRNSEVRDIAFTLFVSKWMFSWWCIYGDDFDVTREILTSFPVDISEISLEDKSSLLALASLLQEKMMLKTNWQRVTFPDKRVIRVGNWDLSACRDVLLEIDSVWSRILNAEGITRDLNFQYASSVKAGLDDEISLENS